MSLGNNSVWACASCYRKTPWPPCPRCGHGIVKQIKTWMVKA